MFATAAAVIALGAQLMSKRMILFAGHCCIWSTYSGALQDAGDFGIYGKFFGTRSPAVGVVRDRTRLVGGKCGG